MQGDQIGTKEQTSHVDHLSLRAIQTFASDHSVSEIFLFGSSAKKTHDRYSDVDLHVVSQNFDATMSQFWHTLSSLGPVLVAFPLHASLGYAAYMVLFEQYSLYTKLDINIADPERSAPFAGTARVYRREVIPPHTASTFLPVLFEEPLNTLYGCYLGAIRYMKYRKRQKHFSAYKFYRAQLDHLLLQWYREISHEHSVERLGILEYQLLDTHEASKKLKCYLYPENEYTMDRLYLELLRTITSQLKMSLNEDHEKAFKTILAFLEQEASEEKIDR